MLRKYAPRDIFFPSFPQFFFRVSLGKKKRENKNKASLKRSTLGNELAGRGKEGSKEKGKKEREKVLDRGQRQTRTIIGRNTMGKKWEEGRGKREDEAG